ncbi:Folylpolyglutamate synthetase [Diaporthe eres]|uniref:Folylpolyglutamate synthetase n=1 Tax=Diaporthe eres TaxID=83184 RepID=A0ABR1NR30_DIAER
MVADINKLNIIHVAGTKGKGSTCAWAESFLRAHGNWTGSPEKTGLYTSPHLICPEERIRISFEPLCKEKFARYFFEVWDHLLEQNDGDTSALPRNLQLLLLVAFHAFISEGVQAAIIETHHGGEYDSTNVVDRPVATVVTSLGMDHIEQLGPTIGNIAWHKAGIFKHGAHAFSAPQDSATAIEVLRRRASDKGAKMSHCFRLVRPGSSRQSKCSIAPSPWLLRATS